ncbi:MarR family transcriptional regulator [Kitasatospora xanthocidica]|uniref:MarR family transcriptional regulator n=1 Tax=Kitasatospora xanthocidica TaxID=83382 RepID=A0A372ZQY6_9ACTN|nr:MarR family transcriptional regulator [Kitasatospora xanthocidica]RGD57687.1 MarR family transcriptional regulator [Kitasatospora xanthocidica]
MSDEEDAEDDRTTACRPQGPNGLDGLEDVLATLAYLLTRSQEHERRTAKAGITAARSDVYLLRALAERAEASRVSDLADRLMVKPSHVTRQIDRLQGQQLVERSQDTQDRRARQVAITPGGREVLDRLKQANIIGLADALDGIPEADVVTTATVLRHLIDRYVHRVRATGADDDPLPDRTDGAAGAPAPATGPRTAAYQGG